jgi:hypothetical protein
MDEIVVNPFGNRSKTIALHLCGLAEADAFDYWSLRTQRKALRFLETEVEVA